MPDYLSAIIIIDLKYVWLGWNICHIVVCHEKFWYFYDYDIMRIGTIRKAGDRSNRQNRTDGQALC